MPAFCQPVGYASLVVTETLAEVANVGVYAQMTAKEFFMVTKGINVEKHSDKLRDVLGKLNKTIGGLRDRLSEYYDRYIDDMSENMARLTVAIDAGAEYVLSTTTATTTSGTTTGTTTTTTTHPLTAQLLIIYAAVGARRGGKVGNVHTDEGIGNIAENVAELFRNEINLAGIPYYLPRVFVNKNRILSQKTTKSAMLLGLSSKMLGYETDEFILEIEAELLEDMSDFVDSHWGLLRGLSWANWDGVSETCLMQSTGQVSYRWDHYVLPILRDVVYGVRMSADRWITLDKYCDKFLEELETNLNLLIRPENNLPNRPGGGPDDDCDCRITQPTMWRGVMLQLGLVITEVEKMAKYFYEIASGTYITESRRDLGILVTEFEHGMASLTEGDPSKQMPSPPTYSLVRQLFDAVKVRFPKFKEVLMLRHTLCTYLAKCTDGVEMTDGTGTLFDDNTTLLLLDQLTEPLKNDLRAAANEYADLCPREVGCINLRRASVQVTIPEQLGKETFMVSIFPNYSIYAKRANKTMVSAASSFDELINGIPGNIDVNQTRDACILDSLDKAQKERYYFEKPVEAVVWSKNLSLEWRMKVQDESKMMSKYANKVVADMAEEKGQIGCENLILTQSGFQQWREGVALASRVGAMGQMAAKEFFTIQKMLDLNDPQYRILIRQWNATLKETGKALEAQLKTLTLGSMSDPDKPPTAPSQLIASAAFDAYDTWKDMEQLLWQSSSNNKVWQTVSQMADQFAEKSDRILHEYVTWCRRSGQDDQLTNPSYLDKTGKPAVLIQKMVKEALLYSLYEAATLEQTFLDYDNAIKEVEETGLSKDVCRQQALASLARTYDAEKPVIDIFRTKATYTVNQILDMINSTGGFFSTALSMQEDFVNRNPECVVESASRKRVTMSGLISLPLMAFFMFTDA
jgi:hypothetical protein